VARRRLALVVATSMRRRQCVVAMIEEWGEKE
jgi:hypothetical protein